MKKTRIVLLTVILLLTLAFSGCGGTDVVAYYLAVDSAALTFDPQIASSGTASLVVRNCFEGLMRIDENGKLKKGLASAYDISADGLTYTFTLRPGTLWHITGNARECLGEKIPEDFNPPVTAHDFEFAVKRAVDPLTGSEFSSLFSSLKGYDGVASGEYGASYLGISAESDSHLVITLSHRDDYFLYKLCEPAAMPCNETFFNACGGRYGLYIKYSMSNGPYYLSRFDETSYRLAKNPDYEGEYKASADVVWLYVNEDENSVVSKVSDGDYNGGFVSAGTYSSLSKKNNFNFVETGDKVRAFLLNPSDSILKEPAVRAAFMCATDPRGFCETAGLEYDSSLLPPVLENRVGIESKFNGKAASKLAASGLEKLEVSSVEITLLCTPVFENALRHQMQTWQQILGAGFNIMLEVCSEQELDSRVKSGDFQIALGTLNAESLSISDYFSVFTENGCLFADDDEVISCVNQIAESPSAESVSAAVSKIADCDIVLPLQSENTVFICSKDYSGPVILPGKYNMYF